MSDFEPSARSKYRRPRREISWVGLFLGLAVGLGGGLFYAWVVDVRVEFDTEPWQLQEQDKAQYTVAVALAYAYDSDLSRAVARLIELRPPGDPIQAAADVACRLATTGYVNSSSGLRAIRAVMRFYQLQGRSGCADTLIAMVEAPTPVVQIDLPTPTPLPPATKTPTPAPAVRPTLTLPLVVIPTAQPQSDFNLVSINTFCDTELSGLIEVFVQDFNGQGIPGQAVRVRWDGGEDTFFTGLKPERGPGYADFQMKPDTGYTIEMPGRSNPSTQPLVAAPCVTDGGGSSVRSYRVFFRPAG